MSAPFSYLFDNHNASHSVGDTASDPMDFTTADGGSTYDGIDTPSTTDDGIKTPTISHLADNVFRGTPAESARTPSAPEPTVLLDQIQHAAEDVSQLVGRFGSKMAKTIQRHQIKKELFADHKLLRLPCLKYADNFTCRVTRLHTRPFDYKDSAPLLWWLWDELLEYLPATFSRGCKLEFTPARETDIALPYTISINLGYKHDSDNIELTASYGGLFHERRIFDAPIARFRLPETKRYGKSTVATLNVDRRTYKEEGCLDHTLDYLLPRTGGIWRHAMEAFPEYEEEKLVVALAGTCKAEDDHYYMSETQAQQCLNLLQRLPPDGKEYIINERLVGKTGGPYSRISNQPPGPKD